MKKRRHKDSKPKNKIVKKIKNVNHYHINKAQKTHGFFGNAYVDKKGNYKKKPFFANFWGEGFLDDVPDRKDYNRVMDGIVHTESLIKKGPYMSEDDYKHALKEEEQDHLYGLERMQISIMRLWNASPREWLKLIFRIGLIIFIFATLFGIANIFFDLSIF